MTPVGKHTLNDKMKKMCNMAGLSGNKTNHSLRATGATHMYESGVPEKLIQERTGHHSLEALQSYERSNAGQHQTVSAILSAPQQQMYNATPLRLVLCFTACNLTLNLNHLIIYLEYPSRTCTDALLRFITNPSHLVPIIWHSHSS